MSSCPGVYFDIGKKAKGFINSFLLFLFQSFTRMNLDPGIFKRILTHFFFVLGVLHKDYAKLSPIHFHYQIVDWNLDLSCQGNVNINSILFCLLLLVKTRS